MVSAPSRYATQQKASDAQYRRAIRAYARGLAPQQAVVCKDATHRPQLSLPTLYRLYGQLRQRLVEAGYYWLTPLDPPDAAELERNPAAAGFRHLIGTEPWQQMEKMVRQRRGVTAQSRPYHQAEIIHRLMNPDLTEWEFISDIENIVRITGPLNHPPKNIEKIVDFLRVRKHMRRIVAVRKSQSLNRDPQVHVWLQSMLDYWLRQLPRIYGGR